MKASFKSSFLNEAQMRGFFYQSTNLEAMDEFLATGSRSAYLGFDITAKSLHVGHMIPIFLLRLFQKHGHKPIVLVGGGTTKIGDPSFKNTARPILSDEQIAENLVGMKKCLEIFLDFNNQNGAQIVNNADWLDKLEYIPFLREIGMYFSVNRMLTFDSVKTKLSENNSLSFLEFNYMILQGYDFYHLHKNYNCMMQFGGQDQWGNIVNGVELIRKKLGKEVFGFTVPLLTTSNGEKMGKTANGAVWLSSDMLAPYDFWQYWRNVDDADVVKLIYLFTDLPIDEIKKMESVQGAELNDLKKLLADEVTTIVHGKDALDGIHNSAAMMFGGKNLSADADLPKFCVKESDLGEVSLVDIVVEMKMCTSRGEAKRLLRSGAVYVNDKAVDENFRLSQNDGKLIKLSCGKKKHILVSVE